MQSFDIQDQTEGGTNALNINSLRFLLHKRTTSERAKTTLQSQILENEEFMFMFMLIILLSIFSKIPKNDILLSIFSKKTSKIVHVEILTSLMGALRTQEYISCHNIQG